MAKITKLGSLIGLGRVEPVFIKEKIVQPYLPSVIDPVGGQVIEISGDIEKSIVIDAKKERKPTIGEPLIDLDKIPGEFVEKAIDNRQVIVSQESEFGSFETLFNDFKFNVEPVYNFYVEDEEENFLTTIKDLKLDDIPRYNLLTWDVAPKNKTSKNKLPSSKYHKGTLNIDDKRKNLSSIRGMEFEKNTTSKDIAPANPYVSPGTIDVILQRKEIVNNEIKNSINENDFLEDESLSGFSIQDIELQRNVIDNGFLNSQKNVLGVIKKNQKNDKENFVEDKLIIKNQNINNQDCVDIASVSNISNVILRASIPKKNKEKRFLVDNIESTQTKLKTKSVKASFVDLFLNGLATKERLSSSFSNEHIETISSLGPFIPNLMTFSYVKDNSRVDRELPSIDSKRNEEGIEYVGYIIEKYEKQDNGVFRLVETINIDDVEKNRYVDFKVLYGKIYRYRIKSVLRFTYRKVIKNNDNVVDFSLNKFADSFFESEWNREWKYAFIIDKTPPNPPDEFLIRPVSNKQQIHVTWKLPENFQRDIVYYRLFRKFVTSGGKDLSSWELIYVSSGANNAIYIDEDVKYFQDENIFYAYCAQTVTIHSEFSKLSEQLAVGLNKEFFRTKEFDLLFLSNSGVDFYDSGPFSRLPIKKEFEEIISKNNILFSLREGFRKKSFKDATYCIRFESLDNGKIIDKIINIKNKQLFFSSRDSLELKNKPKISSFSFGKTKKEV